MHQKSVQRRFGKHQPKKRSPDTVATLFPGGGRKFTFEAHWGEDAGGGQRNIPHAWRPRQAGSADYVWLNGWLVMCLMVCWSVCCGIVCLVACVLACCFLNTPSRCAVRAFFSFSCLRGTGGGSSPSAIMENTIFFFCPVAGAALPNFISQPQPYLVFSY